MVTEIGGGFIIIFWAKRGHAIHSLRARQSADGTIHEAISSHGIRSIFSSLHATGLSHRFTDAQVCEGCVKQTRNM